MIGLNLYLSIYCVFLQKICDTAAMQCKFTIVTITYNAERFIEGTMLSVLGQTYRNFEYILVDGGSKDHTVEIIQRLAAANPDVPIHWTSEPDKGLYDAMNKGLNRATGDFVWFMNAGDKIYDENILQIMADAYAQHPDSDVIYGQSLIIDEQDKPLGERHKIAPANLTRKSMLHGLVVCHQSILVRPTVAPQYDLQYRISADYDWVCKVLAKSRGNLYINQYISRFMTSGVSAQQRTRSWKERFRIMKRHFGLCRTLWAHFLIIAKYPFTKKYN